MVADDRLACLWDDLELITTPKGSTHPLFPVRIESLLLSLLAETIKKELLDPHRPLDLPHWSFRKRIFTREMEDNKFLAPENLIDYVLWYGHCWELETNMIAMKSKSPVPQSWILLRNMSIIHHARKLAGRDAVLYGVITDGSKWVFIHLTNWGRVSDFESGILSNIVTYTVFSVYNQGILLGQRATLDYWPGPEHNQPGLCSSQKDIITNVSADSYRSSY